MISDKPALSDAERELRAEAVRYGRGSVYLSGFTLPPETEAIDRQYIAGEISPEERSTAYRRLVGLE